MLDTDACDSRLYDIVGAARKDQGTSRMSVEISYKCREAK